MKSIIDSNEVIAIAFGEADHLSCEAVSEADIMVASDRYLRPILGQKLIDALIEGKYSDLVDDYVAPALAYAVRMVVQPAINLRLGDSGLFSPKTDSSQRPDREAVEGLQRSIRVRARQLLRRLSDYVECNASKFKEYESCENIFNRCSIDGGFVQVF